MGETLRGIGVSPGAALGPAYVLHAVRGQRTAGTPEEEARAFEEAMTRAITQLEVLAQQLRQAGHEDEAGILDAQALMAGDPALAGEVGERISAGEAADLAVLTTARQFQDQLQALDDPYMAARAADVGDVADRIVRLLTGATQEPLPAHPYILVAHDLTPSQTAGIDRSLTLGFVTDVGSNNAHSAILARALGIPAVVGLGDVGSRIASGQTIGLDGDAGSVIVDPPATDRERIKRAMQQRQGRIRRLQGLRDEAAETADKFRVTLAANIGSPADVEMAVEVGARSVGLLRTEFLFADRASMPDEREQEEIYRSVLAAMADTVVIRTLDVGGDKPLPYFPSETEANPFLGNRGLRYALQHEALLRTQLSALLRASSAGKLAIMVPMVATMGEIQRVRDLFREVREEVGGRAQLGIMVEIPAAAVLADRLATHVDFFSLGTNDLVQYTMAVDRTNAAVASLYQQLNPAVLRLIRSTVEGAHGHGRWAGVCGEMAGDPLAIPLLLGLGVDELSMAPSRILGAKALIRSLHMDVCRGLAQQALDLDTAAAVEALVRRAIPETQA